MKPMREKTESIAGERTQGQWSVKGPEVQNQDGLMLARVNKLSIGWKGNVQLMAAAPELLEALSGIVHVLMSGNENWTIKCDAVQGWAQRGLTAIARAEGSQ